MVLMESSKREEEILMKDKPNPSEPETKTKEVDSDGFETASEREISDDEEYEEEPHQKKALSIRYSATCYIHLSGSVKKEKAMVEANEAKVEGNRLFVNALYEEALSKYILALELVKEFSESIDLRSICYLNRGVCFLKLGKYEDTIKECTKALEIYSSYTKALVRRAEANEKLQHFEEAVSDLKKIVELDPSNDEARKGIRRLEPLAAEKREKMKEEAITKLKELGTSLLGRFGMSMDKFKAVQDPKTGSYSFSYE